MAAQTEEPAAAGARERDELLLRARRRATQLHTIAAALSRAVTRAEVASIAIEQSFEALPLVAAVAYFMSSSGDLVYGASRGLPDETVTRLQTVSLDAPLPLCEAVRTNEPVWLDSYEEVLARYPQFRGAATPIELLQTVAALPLITEGAVAGGIAFSFQSGHHLDEDERTFLSTIAAHASLALERSRLIAEEQSAKNRLAILANASRRFSEAKLELGEILSTVTREVAAELRESCAINLLSADGKTLDPVASHHLDPEVDVSARRTMAIAPVRLDDENSVSRVARTGEPLLVRVMPPELLTGPTVKAEYREHLARYPIGSLLIVPLRVRETIIGTMTVTRGRGGPPFTVDDQSLVQDLADHAALAIANARQHEELGQERRRLDLLATFSQTLATSLDYETTLRNVIDLALPLLGDVGYLDLVERGRPLRRVGRAPGDPSRQALLDESAWGRDGAPPAWSALSTGQPTIHPAIDEAWLARAAGVPDAELLWALGARSLVTAPLGYRGRQLGALTLVFSGSGRRHADADLRLTEELARRAAAALENARLYRESREAIAIRDDFLSIASHELNTPLTALQLQIQSLKMRAVNEGIGDEFVNRLSRTERHVSRLEKLVRNLLDVSRIRGGRLMIQRQNVDLVAAVKEATDRHVPHASAFGCTLVFRAEGVIHGAWDPLWIDQVVVNLIDNAVKYGAGKPVEVVVDSDGGTATIAVRDHGIGIAVGQEERIFHRFERAVSERNYGGFGLGLWIVREIVHAHGGSIGFERVPEGGTRFVVELPVDGDA